MPLTIDIEAIRKDKSIDSKVKEVYEYLKLYMDEQSRSDWLKRREKCWKAIENEMWDDKQKDELRQAGMDALVINKLNKGVQGSCAIVTDQKPEVKFFPIGSSDLYVAELLKRGHDLIWEKNEGNDIVYDIVEEAKIGGIGFVNGYHDPSKGVYGRIIFEEEAPDDIFWDAQSRKRDFSDTHLIKAKLRSKSWIKEKYGEIKEDDLYFEKQMQPDKEGAHKSSGITSGDNYAVPGNAQDPQRGSNPEPQDIWEIEAWIIKTVEEHWYIRQGENGQVETAQMGNEIKNKKQAEEFAFVNNAEHWHRKLEKRFQRIIVGKKLIEETPNPYGEDAEGNPVIPLISLRHQRTRTSYPMSPTAYAVDVNVEKNKRRSQFILASSQNINSPIIEPANSVKWVGTPGTPGSRAIVSKNAPFQPMRMQSGALDIGQFVNLEQLADKDIDDQYDISDVLRGKIPEGQTNIAARTVMALQDMGGMMSKPFLRALESSLVRLAKLNICLALKHWPRDMWERLIEEDEMESWTPDGRFTGIDDPALTPESKMKITQDWLMALEKIRPQDPAQPPGVTLLDLDVKMIAGSSLPTNRIAKGQMAIEFMQAGIYDAQAALEYVDDPGKDKIIERLKAQQEQMAAMGEAGGAFPTKK